LAFGYLAAWLQGIAGLAVLPGLYLAILAFMQARQKECQAAFGGLGWLHGSLAGLAYLCR